MTHVLSESPSVSRPADPSPRVAARKRDNRFYTTMGVVALLVAIVGFSNSLAGAVNGSKTFTRLVHIHGALFGFWMVFFILQARLIASGRVAIHRRLGVAGALLATTMIGVGLRTAIVAARHGYDLDRRGDPLGFMIFPLGDLTSFAILVAAAIWFRKRPMAHKRLMLMATVGAMLNAPMAHLIATTPTLASIQAPIILLPIVLLLSANAIYDKITLGRIHPVSLWVAIALFVWDNLRAAVIRPTGAWHAFAGWLIS
jgi:hypothetical protein